nr:hypothetical protein [Paenibacillus sp. SYP-B3998]
MALIEVSDLVKEFHRFEWSGQVFYSENVDRHFGAYFGSDLYWRPLSNSKMPS